MGKTTEANKIALKENTKQFEEKGITNCEVCEVLKEMGRMKGGCFRDNYLSFAHRHKRIWYKRQLDKLYDFKQVILACPTGHSIIEKDKELTEQVFNVLRGSE